MIKADDKALCSGCGVCREICPKRCIGWSEDVLGSRVAEADAEACVRCGACEAVCPMRKPADGERVGASAYAAWAVDPEVRRRGASGGLFETLASRVIAQSGSVFASRFDDGLKLRMFEAVTEEEVRALTKSKYLQSEVAPCLPAIRERIRQGRAVLVCAAPCQIAALQSALGEAANADGLYLVDFFCHGVPSQAFFDRCVEYVQKRDGIRVNGYEFRTKIRNGATPHYYTLDYTKNGRRRKKTALYLKDPFYLGFQKYLTLRDSCYRCPFGSGGHAGDLTVGDFHNVGRYVKGVDRFEGVSTVVVNTEKGRRLWESVRGSLIAREVDVGRLRADGEIYAGGTAEPPERAAFLRDMERLPFDEAAAKWLNARREWKKAVYYRLPRPLRKLAKTLAGL